MQQVTTTINEHNGNFYVPLEDATELLRQHSELLKENEALKMKLYHEPVWIEGLDWLAKQVSIKSHTTLTKNILEPNRQILSVENGGPVRFSKGKGSPWRFEPEGMRAFLKEYFPKLLIKNIKGI